MINRERLVIIVDGKKIAFCDSMTLTLSKDIDKSIGWSYSRDINRCEYYVYTTNGIIKIEL